MATNENCGESCKCYYDLLNIAKPDPSDQGPNADEVKQNYKRLVIFIHQSDTDADRAHMVSTLLYQAQFVLSDGLREQQYRLFGMLSSKFSHKKAEAESAVRFMMEKLVQSDPYDIKTDEEPNHWSSKVKNNSENSMENPSSIRMFEADERYQQSLSECDLKIQTETDTQSAKTTNSRRDSSYGWHSRHPGEFLTAPEINQRHITKIIDHNVRPNKVFFIVKWDDDGECGRIESKILVNGYVNELADYLKNTSIRSPRRFAFLLNREPMLAKIFKTTNIA